MALEITRTLRKKYKSRLYGSKLFSRTPQGGGDIIKLCDMADRLEAIVRDLQRRLPEDQQNEIERRIWNL